MGKDAQSHPELPAIRQGLERLSRWACVAVAVRCAQRVAPLYGDLWPGAPKDYVSSLARLVHVVAESARLGRVAVALPWHSVAGPYFAAEAAARQHEDGSDLWRAAAAANTARAAAATLSTTSYGITSTDTKMKVAAEIRGYTLEAIEAAITAAAPNAAELARAVLSDIDKLALPGTLMFYEPGSAPVDPDSCGPVWPTGRPSGWPAELTLPSAAVPTRDSPPRADSADSLELRIRVPAVASEAEIRELVREYVLASSELHLGHGGSGLVADTIDVYEAAFRPEGAPR